MNTAEQILVVILATALAILLVLSIILLIKLIILTKEAKKIIIKGQGIAEKTDDIVGNVKDLTSVGGIIKTFAHKCEEKINAKGGKNGN